MRSSALLAYIKVSAGDSQLGISIVGYGGKRPGGLYVSRIHEHSAAMRDARLEPGDRINSVNGLRLGRLSNDDAFRLLRATVSRQLGSEHTVRLGIIRSRDGSVLRHWQRWSDNDDNTVTPSVNSSSSCATTTTTTTTSSSSRPTAVVQGSIAPVSSMSVYFTTTRF